MKMKKSRLSLMALLLAASILPSCKKDDENNVEIKGEDLPFLFNGTEIGNGNKEFEINGKYTLPKGVYTMKGFVYITKGSELTIEPGTVIKGDTKTMATLIVEPGGKIYAQGSKSEPIVFTSSKEPGQRKPGDWGGVIICGYAQNNLGKQLIEGGPRTEHGNIEGFVKNDDNSGIFSYVRLEYPGYPFDTDKEINGLTMGSVGSGTKIDHVQVSYCNDDSFEWFGGNVNCKNLVAYHGWDDDFDTDNGFSGKLQFLLGVRNPKIADTSISNGFESDNSSTSQGTPYTSPVFSNVTLVGPVAQASDFENSSSYIRPGDINLNPNNGSKTGVFQAAMQVRRNSHLNCFNSVAIGYPVGLIIENDKSSTTQTWADNGDLKLKNLVFANMTIMGSDKNKSFLDQYSADASTMDETKESFSSTFFKNIANNNRYFESVNDLKLVQPNSTLSNPSYAPQSGSPLLSGADFSDPLLSSGFEKVSYIGAFASTSDNWMEGWTNFDPQNTVY